MGSQIVTFININRSKFSIINFMGWCFALINGRLAEIFFEKKGKKVLLKGHCFVKEEEYKTKQEKTWIKKDTNQYQFRHKGGKYTEINSSSQRPLQEQPE